VRAPIFFLIASAAGAAVFGAGLLIGNDYVFYAGFVVLQYIVLATAWNILGGYCGYVNFGSAAFFAIGAYSAIAVGAYSRVARGKLLPLLDYWFPAPLAEFLKLIFPLPVPIVIVVAGVIAGVVGLGMGYLTLRLRGVFFAIATLAFAVVLQTLITNWDYVGGSRGAYFIIPLNLTLAGIQLGFIQYLFLLMLFLSVIAITIARLIERSRLGYGFATIRDDELAAEACGVPTLRLKLIATTISGALMGMAGALFPYSIGFIEPASAFNLAYGVNSIAMPMIGGTTSWVGPLIGAILLGTLQQVATVTISSAANLLIVGFLLIGFVIIAPNGIVGLVKDFLHFTAPSRLSASALGLLLIASYCFLVGLGGVILGLSTALGTKSSIVATMGISTVILSFIYLVAAYGVLKVESWSRLLTTAALAISIPLSLFYIWMDRSFWSVLLEAISVSFALVALWYLQSETVKRLYRPATERQVTS
jgi:branched-chain amino acid transport system permease protein